MVALLRLSRSAVALAAAMFLAFCGKDISMTETCPHTMSVGSGSRKIPHPEKQSFCKGVDMQCNYCEYDANGTLQRSGSEACGVCVGANF